MTRLFTSLVLVFSLTASILAVTPLPASAADPPLPPGASRFHPVQGQGSAAGRNGAVPATETDAARSVPPGPPVLPPSAAGVVGPEKRFPDPATVDGPQCRDCPLSTVPVPQPRDGKSSEGTQEVALSHRPPTGFVPGMSRELTGERTATSTRFANPDGTRTLRMYSGPRHVRDAAGGMVPIDARLERGSDNRFRPVAAETVSFAPLSTDPSLGSYQLGEGLSVSFGLVDGAPVAGVARGSDLVFPGVRPHADLVVGASATGIKEAIVLKSDAAPTRWRFRLQLNGLTPELAGSTGRIDLRDAAGIVRALIPPGFMVDASGPGGRDGAYSTGVRYSLVRDGGIWMLDVALDEQWLRDPARRYPVTVDPTLTRFQPDNDTFTSSRDFADSDNQWLPFMKAGTYNGGAEIGAAYIHFFNADYMLWKKSVLEASLNVYTMWSGPVNRCTAAPLYVYPAWVEANHNVNPWPGPPYDAARPLAVKTFARGMYCPNGEGYEEINLDPAWFSAWSHGIETWSGITLRASSTDNKADKFFRTFDHANGMTGPFLDVLYADEGATYSLPTARISPPVTPSTQGWLYVLARNTGQTDWTPTNGFRLVSIVRNASGAEVGRSTYPVGATVPSVRMGTGAFNLAIGPLAAGTYSLRLTMQDGAGRLFDDFYGSPRATVSFQVLPESAPELVSFHPPNNAHVDTIQPTLWAQYYDADAAPGEPRYWFKICNGTEQAPVGCQETGWIDSATWTVPAGKFAWGTTSFWYVALYDGDNMTYLTGPYYLTPTVAQPEITHHLASAPDDADVAGLNPQAGNYSTAAVDASVPVPGPPLEIRRTYNSQDPRTTGAFGAGWSVRLDQRLVVDQDGSSNVVVTLESGRQVRFGRNADGSYAPPPGHRMTLVRGTSSWTLRDASGEQRYFDDAGKLLTTVDPYGRQQQYLYTAGLVSQVKDLASGRSLFLTWAGGHVTTVKTDAPVAGGTQPTWTYQYSGHQLVKVCSPLSAQSCVDYQTVAASHYRSVVADDNPTAYWPLGEASGNTAANVVARSPGERDATYAGVTLNQPGVLAGSPDTAVTVGASATDAIRLPANLTNTSLALAVEVWFKAAGGQRGVLYSYQDADLAQSPAGHVPALYVGTDGKLRGYYWTPSGTQMVSAARVDDGVWHHAVLVGVVDRQELYLDGVRLGQVTTAPIAFGHMNRAFVGNGSTSGWPAGVAGNFSFTGQIDEVAFYRHPLGSAQVSAHYAARAATSRLTKHIEPGAFTAVNVGYDARSGRVSTMQDRHGAVWTMSQPSIGAGTRAVTLSSTARDSVTYTFDANRGGRLVTRTTGAGTETWGYDNFGFVATYTDANDRIRHLYRDARGNVTWESVFRSGAWVWKNYGYFYNASNKLDPRNDRLIWQSGTRNAWDSDPFNRIWYDLDAAGRVTQVTLPGMAGAPALPTEHFSYTTGTEAAVGGGTVPAGLLASTTNALGGVTALSYNSRGDIVRSVDPVGLATDHTYDLMGRVRTRTTGAVVAGSTVTYGTWTTVYNAASLVTSETAPGITNPLTGVVHTAVTSYTYDARGLVTRVDSADSTGGDPTRTWRYTYDPAGRRKTATAPDNGQTTVDWNTAGDVAKLTRPNGLVLEYRYDDRRHLIETAAVGSGVDPANPAATRLVLESRGYDPAGQLAFVVDAIGRETAFTYHNDGLLESKKRIRRNVDGEITSTTLLGLYEYDHGANLIRVTEAGGVVRDFDYDDAGLRNRESLDPGGVARSAIYTFTSDGRMASRKESNGFTFVTGRSSEVPYLVANNGSQIDGAGSRYADGTSTFTYRFTLPANAAKATLNLEVDNQFLVQVSSDNQNWSDMIRETRDIRDGSNRKQWFLSLDSRLQTSKTLYVRIGDSQPANGWGAAVSRVAMEYSVTGEQAAKTGYEYDRAGRQLKTTVDNPGGSPGALVTSVSRDPRGLVTRLTDPASSVTDITYDGAGNRQTVEEAPRTVWRDGLRTDSVRPKRTFGHNVFGEVTHERDAYGATTTTQHDLMGRPATMTLPPYTPPGGAELTPVTTTTYNVDGQPTEVTDPLGRKTTYGYDKYGRVISEALPDPDGGGPAGRPTSTYLYDRAGHTLQTTDPAGARTLATYNDLGYQVTSTAAERVGGSTVFYTTGLVRDEAGLLTSLTTPSTHTSTFQYNQAGEQTKATDAAGRFVDRRYDFAGRLTAEIHGGVRATSHGYDTAGRQVAISSHTVAGGALSTPLRTISMAYDAMGRLVRRTSGAGRITQYGYDPGGNLTAVSQRVNPADAASTVTVELGYDALGRHSRTVDGNGNATDFLHNSWGLLTAVREPDTATFTTVYDAAGQPVGELAPGGISRTRTYDGLGRLTAETGAGTAGATIARGVEYDAVGRLARVAGPAGDTTYSYNDRGLLIRSVGPSGTATFEYDGEGKLLRRADAAGTGTFWWGSTGRLIGFTDAFTGRAATLTYTSTGELASISYGAGGPSRTFGYDNLGRLASDTVKRPDGSASLSTTYGYDLDDLLTSRTTTGFAGGGANAYGHDGLARLTSWTRPDGQRVDYGYDRASNRTSVTGPDGTRTYTYDSRNRLLGASGTGPSLTNTWTYRGALASTTRDGITTTFRTDAFDRTVAAQTESSSISYAYDSLDRLVQRNGAGLGYADLTNNPVRTITAGGAALVFRGPDGTPISDRHGSDAGRLLITDRLHGDQVGAVDTASGTAVASRSYAPQGEVTTTTGLFSAGFQGGFADIDTGLVNAHARWYDPGQATFTSRDSWTLHPDPLPAANRYAYANANPTTFADPTGHAVPLAAAAWWGGAVIVGAVAGWLVADQFSGSESAKNMVDALLDLQNGALIAFMKGLIEIGASADEVIRQVRSRFADHTEVTQITGAATVAPASSVPEHVRVKAQLEAQAAAAAAAVAVAAAAVAALQAELAARLAYIAAMQPTSVTISNYRSPEVSLLPAGQLLQNTVPAATALAGAPAITMVNADGSDALNAAVAGTAGAIAASMADTGSPNNDDDDGCGSSGSGQDAPSTVDPLEVRFSQKGASPKFQNGNTIEETAELLRSGVISAADFPLIRLVDRGGILYTLDNRRLVAFQKAGLPRIPFRMATAQEILDEAWKFDPGTDGTCIRIRKGGGIWRPKG